MFGPNLTRKLNQGRKPAVPWWLNFDPYTHILQRPKCGSCLLPHLLDQLEGRSEVTSATRSSEPNQNNQQSPKIRKHPGHLRDFQNQQPLHRLKHFPASLPYWTLRQPPVWQWPLSMVLYVMILGLMLASPKKSMHNLPSRQCAVDRSRMKGCGLLHVLDDCWNPIHASDIRTV